MGEEGPRSQAWCCVILFLRPWFVWRGFALVPLPAGGPAASVPRHAFHAHAKMPPELTNTRRAASGQHSPLTTAPRETDPAAKAKRQCSPLQPTPCTQLQKEQQQQQQ
eukprot:3786640-Rhodomonas_salina.1